MNKEKIERAFSKERLHKYFTFVNGDEEKAIELYKANIRLSESFFSLLSVLEIALRNNINAEMTKHFQKDDWYSELTIPELFNEIQAAIAKIQKRDEILSPHKITAELTLGFWSRLFNAKYEQLLWKQLRKAFPNIPKNERQHHVVSAPINRIRILRNRVFHHEPIIWNINKIEFLINEIYRMIEWLNSDLPYFSKDIDNTSREINRIKQLLAK